MHELPDTARAVAKELMGAASPVGVRALPQAARVPRAHPRLARAMVISCSTLAVARSRWRLGLGVIGGRW